LPNSPLFRAATWLLMVLLIALVGSEVPFIFSPLIVAFRAVFFPALIAGLFYYWLNPIVRRLGNLRLPNNLRLPKGLAIMLVFGLIIGTVALLVALAGPPLQQQIAGLVSNAPRLVRVLQGHLLTLEENEWVVRLLGPQALNLDGLVNQVTALASSLLTTIGENITPIIKVTTDVLTMLFLVPFILFYMLADGEKLAPTLVSYLLPQSLQDEGRRILRDMDQALSAYIQGQALVSLSVGLLTFLGYLIIGLDYALLLALVMAVTNIIPFVGPLLGGIPAIIVGLVMSPGMAVRVLFVIVVAQQVESLLISPRIMGKKLGSHPVVILFVILISGSLAGFWGVLFAIPAFAVLRVAVSHLYSLALLYRHNFTKSNPD